MNMLLLCMLVCIVVNICGTAQLLIGNGHKYIFLSGNFQSFPESLVGVLPFSRRYWNLQQLPSVLRMLQHCLLLKLQHDFSFHVLNLWGFMWQTSGHP